MADPRMPFAAAMSNGAPAPVATGPVVTGGNPGPTARGAVQNAQAGGPSQAMTSQAAHRLLMDLIQRANAGDPQARALLMKLMPHGLAGGAPSLHPAAPTGPQGAPGPTAGPAYVQPRPGGGM